MNIDKYNVNDILKYIKKYSYIHCGELYVDYGNTRYSVSGIIKAINLLGIIS